MWNINRAAKAAVVECNHRAAQFQAIAEFMCHYMAELHELVTTCGLRDMYSEMVHEQTGDWFNTWEDNLSLRMLMQNMWQKVKEKKRGCCTKGLEDKLIQTNIRKSNLKFIYLVFSVYNLKKRMWNENRIILREFLLQEDNIVYFSYNIYQGFHN